MSHIDVNQAITNCKDKSYREVLPLLEALVNGVHNNKGLFTTESLATAMHRIASTGASDGNVIGEIQNDKRFQALVQEVEHRLRTVPNQFNNQSLANVVWGAGKLRLSQRPDLFQAVEREVLSPRRHLSSFTPQQLAAIAWGFVAAEMNAPNLFYAIQMEALGQPTLNDLLKKAGLLQHLQQRGVQSLNNPMGMLQSLGGVPAAQYSHLGRGNGHAAAPVATNRQACGSNGGAMSAAHVPSTAGAHIHSGGHSQIASASPPQYTAASVGSIGMNGIAPASPHLNGISSTALSKPLSDAVNRPDVAVAVAAEEHKKEMERKQREVLGDADLEGTCPLCIEPMDETDKSFLPCPCGYQICRLCYHRIVNLETKTCPACRAEYKEENIQKKSLPEKQKTETDAGWESGKKKAKDKKPALPTYAGFPAKVRELLLHCHEIGHVVKGELDERILDDLKALPERGAVAALNEFIKKDMSRIRNKCAFLHRIIQRVQEEHQNDRSAYERYASGGGANPLGGPANALPAAQVPPLPPQRARASSDVGCTQRGGGSSSATFGVGGYAAGDLQQPMKGIGWAEKENGSQPYGYHGAVGGIDMHSDALRTSGDLITAECAPPRRQMDEYLQSRPSLQLSGAYRQHSNVVGPGDLNRYREPIGGAGMIAPQQLNALKLSEHGKEALSPAAGAEAGSRLLAMLQGGAQGNAVTQFGGDRKPPLFARAGGISHASGRELPRGGEYASRDGGYGSHLNMGMEDEPLAMIARGESSGSGLGHCRQCGQRKYGDVDTSDGHFYCEDCWKVFESARGESSVLSLVR